MSVLLRRQRRPQSKCKRLLRWRSRERRDRQIFQQLESSIAGELVSLHDLCRVQAERDQ